MERPPDPSAYLLIVSDPPDRMLSRELALWLRDLSLWSNVRFYDSGQRHSDCQYNQALRYALRFNTPDGRPAQWFVFADSDIRPHIAHMAEFWTAPGDVVGAIYPTENPNSHAKPEEIHTGLWRTRREVLQAVLAQDAAPFAWEFDAHRTRVTKCPCRHFCDLVRAAGFTVSQAGHALHCPRKPPGF